MMNTWNPAEIMERLNHLESIVKGIPTPVDVVANPEGEASTDLEKLTVGDTTYAIPEGTAVEANPEGEASTDLTKLTVGETIYAIPEGGGLPDLSTTEVLTGRTYNGSPTYVKIIMFNETIQINSNLSWYTMPGTMPSNMNNIIGATVKHFASGVCNCFDVQLSSGNIQLRNHSMQNETFSTSDCVIVEYTKSS